MRLRVPTLLVLALLVFAAATPAQAQLFDRGDASRLAFGVGAFDVLKDETAADFRAEWRGGGGLFDIVKPFVGVELTSDGAFWGGGGIYVDLFLNESIVLTGSFAPGYYQEGGGKDLGYELEFRSQIELAYRFENRSRLSLAFSHLSNAGLGDSNPGTEVLNVYYSLPVQNLLRLF
jgi:lipid A 3-O-deacylase